MDALNRGAARRTLLAAPLTRTDPPLEEQVATAIADGVDLFELRVDSIEDIAAVERLLAAPRSRAQSGAPADYILTIRSTAEGGLFDGDDAERIALIERLGLLNPGYVDVELSAWRRSANLRQKVGLVCDVGGPQPLQPLDRRRNRLILSRHDWRETPADLARVFDELLETPGVIAKAAFRAADATDALRVLAELRRRPGREVIAIAMDEGGAASRLLAPKFGAFLSFAARCEDDASAPGQITVRRMRDEFRWLTIGPHTRVFGVIGWPIAHSQSPLIHNAAMAADGIDGVYVPLAVGPSYEAFARFMDYATGAAWLDLSGLSVTIPHKEHALRWLRERKFANSPRAARAGAANTLSRAGSDWVGDNTDGVGAVAALLRLPGLATGGLHGKRVAILGAGGAAQGVAAALLEIGARIVVCNRDGGRGTSLAGALGAEALEWERRGSHDAEVVVNCTSLGMSPQEGESPLPAEAHRPGVVVLDTVYTPAETRLLREARAAGCATVSGVEMFLAQAAAQYEQWHGHSAPGAVMRAALERAAPGD